jgi:hypothetical protein
MISQVMKSTLMVLLVMAAPLGSAAEPLKKEQMDKLRAALEVPGAGVTVLSAQTSEMPGVVEVQLSDGPLVYSSLAGDFFIVGDLSLASIDC